MSKTIFKALCFSLLALISPATFAQPDDQPQTSPDPQQSESVLDDIEISAMLRPLCFGVRGIVELQALAICDALKLRENVKARELSENWLRRQPRSAAANFALAEVLFRVEGNLPRALFHLNRAEELTGFTSLGRATAENGAMWYLLTLSQLSYVHQLMENQLASLEYLDKIEEIFGQDLEAFRGWPLIKMKRYAEARRSAEKVLANSDSDRDRSRAWNTLCAVELASLRPQESLAACNRAIDEDEALAAQNDSDTIYLLNASEVSLSLLQLQAAEDYLDRAARFIDPNSVGDPWIYLLYLYMSQGRFEESRQALDSMLMWRSSQTPIVGVMNRAEHFLVSSAFLLLAGYAEDAAKLTAIALNQPDRNGSYSADNAQKDSVAALMNMMANNTIYEIKREQMATMDLSETIMSQIQAMTYKFKAWRSARHAASLFADIDILQSRLRPYAPLDVHIPEWIEPELIGLLGEGVMASVLEQANNNGAFVLNQGYYLAYKAEIAYLDNRYADALQHGTAALKYLPEMEVLLKARLALRIAASAGKLGQINTSLQHYAMAYQGDHSVIRRLGESIPVRFRGDNSVFANQVIEYLRKSPRFHEQEAGLTIEVAQSPALSACLITTTGDTLNCFQMELDDSESSKWNAQQLVNQFHNNVFGLGYDISKAQRLALLGSSVILSSQNNANLRNSRDAVLR